MTLSDLLAVRYPHMRFAKQWRIDGDLEYHLGQSDSLADVLSMAPLLPRFRRDLHLLSMRKGAFARIDADRPLEAGSGTLRWLVSPDLLGGRYTR